MATAIKSARRRTARPRAALTENPVRQLRQQYCIPQALLARMLDVSLRTVSSLETGAMPVAKVHRNLTQATRLCDALAESMKSGYVGRWLDEFNDMLDGLKPIEAIERGRVDLVWQVADGLKFGSQL